jgi:hypothetical protein
MELTSPTPSIMPVVDDKIERMKRKNYAVVGGRNAAFTAADETTLPGLMQRASNAARQMRYFGLVAKRSSFSELLPSARRAGFTPLSEDTQRKEATFQWSAGEPDFVFSASFNDAARASIIAESRGDIFGLILTGCSDVPSVSVETNPSLENNELGQNALLFQDILLMFPDFDDLPAWTKYPELDVPDAGGSHWERIFDFARLRRGGLTAASAVYRNWKSIASQVSTTCGIFQDRWHRSR